MENTKPMKFGGALSRAVADYLVVEPVELGATTGG
jgi:hypothetical protein